MSATPLRIYIIDDDVAVVDALGLLMRLHGFDTVAFRSAEDFLADYSPEWSGVVLVDLRMPGMSGLELQAVLQARKIPLPVIIITAHGETAAARRSFKSGALDFLEKPIDSEQLVNAILDGLKREAGRLERAGYEAKVARHLASLTPREREVLERVVAGRRNREIASELSISVRTVEVYKARLMLKMGVERIPDLVRVVMSLSH